MLLAREGMSATARFGRKGDTYRDALVASASSVPSAMSRPNALILRFTCGEPGFGWEKSCAGVLVYLDEALLLLIWEPEPLDNTRQFVAQALGRSLSTCKRSGRRPLVRDITAHLSPSLSRWIHPRWRSGVGWNLIAIRPA